VSKIPVAARTHTEDLGAFVTASPSSYHAAQEVARRARETGFTELPEAGQWSVQPGCKHFVVRDGAIIVFAIPLDAGPTTPFSIIGTHTDSPGFKLKPHPTSSNFGYWQAGVEVYGSPLLNSWLDREFEFAGRLVTAEGEYLSRTGPIARIPQLAIHLDRTQNKTLTLDAQRHTQPVWGLGKGSEADLLAVLAEKVGVDRDDVLGYDIVTADTQPPRAFGADQALWASGRLDNLLCTHAGITALIDAVAAGPAITDTEFPLGVADDGSSSPILLLCCFDHEEIGSATRTGAAGPFLTNVLRRIQVSLGANEDERSRSFANSILVSADVGHGIHPDYPEKHDPINHPKCGHGPILKINANQRYATDAIGAARWQLACINADVPHQEFVSNNDITCGSTIGPLEATRVGIRAVDVGVPILSMHSARELAAVVDPWYLTRALTAFLRGPSA